MLIFDHVKVVNSTTFLGRKSIQIILPKGKALSDKELLPEGFNELGLEDLAELKSALLDQALALREKDAPTADDAVAAGQIKTALDAVSEAIAKTTKATIEATLGDIEQVFETEDFETEIEDSTESGDVEESTENFETEESDQISDVDTEDVTETEAVELDVETEQENVADADADEASEDFATDEDENETEVTETEVELDSETEDVADVAEDADPVSIEAELETEADAVDNDTEDFNEDSETETGAEALEATEDIEVEETVDADMDLETTEPESLDSTEEISAESDAAEVSEELEVSGDIATDEDSEDAEVELSEISETQEEEAKVAELNNVTDEESNEMSEKTEGALDSAEFFVPSESAAPRSSVIATAGATTKNVGDAYNDMGELALEVGASWKRLGGERGWTNVAQGANEQFNIASFVSNADDVPTISTMNEERNFQIFDQAIGNFKSDLDSDNALVASGGICAPFEQDYSFFRLALPQNPVEAGLPVVNASRGGIRYMAPVDFTGARASIAVVSEAEDAAGYTADGAGGTAIFKPCPTVACPPVQECTVSAVPYCVKWGNFNYYTFPELIENYMRDLMVNFAKVKETFYLDQIKAASTAVTASDSPYGASRSMTDELRRAAINYRKRHNMNANATLQVLLPDWSAELVKQDMAFDHSLGLEHMAVSNELVARIFSDMNLAVSFYYDTATGDGQDFSGAQAVGELNAWPANVISFMFAPGTFVRLSGGSLDFGLVRDSSLIRTNDLIVAAEEFTGLCKIGYESLMITHEAVASGATVNEGTVANRENPTA